MLAPHCYEWMFYNCSALTSAPELPATTLADACYSMMFRDCTGLTSVTIPGNVTLIDNCMFLWCQNLEEVFVSAGVTNIGSYAFENNEKLTRVYIPETVTEIGDGAFEKCPNLTIYGKSGSYAETYAKENNIPFKAVKEPSLEVSKTVTEAGTTYTVTATNLPTKAIIIVAMYKDGKFVGCETANCTGEALNITTQIPHDSVKIMVWENLANMIPILPAVEK